MHHDDTHHRTDDDRRGPRGRGRGRGRGPGPRGRGGRMRRGDIRTAVLAVLADGEAHGYQVMQALESRTEGAWRPSPGSIYPTLQLLEDTGLATATTVDDKRVYGITDEGRDELARRVDEAGGLPWERGSRSSGGGSLRRSLSQLHAAARQVDVEGDPAQLERATAILDDARKKLYGLLAE